jgi:hypothetical protein
MFLQSVKIQFLEFKIQKLRISAVPVAGDRPWNGTETTLHSRICHGNTAGGARRGFGRGGAKSLGSHKLWSEIPRGSATVWLLLNLIFNDGILIQTRGQRVVVGVVLFKRGMVRVGVDIRLRVWERKNGRCCLSVSFQTNTQPVQENNNGCHGSQSRVSKCHAHPHVTYGIGNHGDEEEESCDGRSSEEDDD